MHTVIKQVLIVFFIFTSGKVLLSQSFVFKNYTTKDGLPSSETYFSIQDEKGYIWIATDRGLAKFDGYNFKTYTTKDGAPDNTIFEIHNDHKNRLWFKGFSSLLGYYKNNSFYNYKYNDSISKILPFELINSFVVEGDNVWFSKFQYIEDNPVREFTLLTKISANGVIDTSYNVYVKGEKVVYITKKGKALFTGDLDAKKTKFYTFESKEKITEIYHKPYGDDILSAKLDKEYFVTVIGRTLFKIKENFSEKILAYDNEAIHLFVDNEKNIWLGYRDSGYECLLAKNNYTKAIKGLNGLTVSSIYQDKEGGMWLTSLEKGVHYLAPHAFRAFTKNQGLVVNKTNKIINANGNVFVLDGGKSILLKKKNKENFEQIITGFPNDPNDIDYTGGKQIYTFKSISRHTPNLENIVLPQDKALIEGKKHVYNIRSRGFNKYSKSGELLDSQNFPVLSRVWCVFEKSDGAILIGTLKGLYLYKDKKLTALKDKNALFGYRINEIKQFDKHRIVVATIGGGILLFNENDIYKVKQYTQADGLPSLMCNTVWKENDTTLWVGTNKGLCLINNILDSSKAKFSTININDGLTSNEVNGLCKVGDDIWVATAGGISIINKSKYLQSPKLIPVYIKDITVNGKAQSPTAKATINYKDNNISISFLGINYQYANQLVYKYRLKNTESKWNYTKNRSVVYSALPAGKYVFEVGVVKPKGGQNPTYAYYSFTILPPYWQTTWFIGIVIIVSLIIIGLFIRVRISFVREQERLKHDLNTFRDKALRGQMNPHFIYNSLNAIQNYILKNDTDSSASFLSKFSQLMRLTFNNTAEELILLEKEIEGLELYAELENLRFNQKFELHINIDKDVDRSIVKMPPLIMQPFVENAILHGILTKSGKGNIWVDIMLKTISNKKALEIAIKDDGIGLKNAEKILERKTRFKNPFASKNKRKNSGIKTTQDRIQQIWGKSITENYFTIVDLQSESNLQTGTLVLFYLPIYD